MLQHLTKIILFCLISGTAISQTSYEVIDLGTLGGNLSYAYGINDSSQVVGRSDFANNEGRAFLWDEGTMTALGTFAGNYSQAWDINNLTQIVGYSHLSAQVKHAFLWDSGNMIDLGTLGGSYSEAYGINNSTRIVGVSLVDSLYGHAFLWENGVMSNLDPLGESSRANDINDINQVVGGSYAGITEATLWQNGQMTVLGTLGGDHSMAFGINNLSQVVGSSRVPGSSNNHAFLWENGTMQDLGVLTGTISIANAINDSSQIVGYFNAGGNWACIWYNGSAFDLNTLIDPNSGWLLHNAYDINNKGEIVGWGFHNNQLRGFLLKPKTFSITSPVAGEKWIAGETDTITWTDGQVGHQLKIDYSTDNGNTFSALASNVPASDGSYIWSIPKTIISTKVKLRFKDVVDTLLIVTSDSFKIKPYIITRIDSSTGDYVAYNINTDKWNFRNSPGHMWDSTWWRQFNYQGVDSFTNQPYPQDGIITFRVAASSIHPDWVSWVNTFGTSNCYHDLGSATYSFLAIIRWQYARDPWNGSCFGIAISNALAFYKKNQFKTRYPTFPNFTNPIDVTSNNQVKKVINELFTHQFGEPHTSYRRNVGRTKTPNQTLADYKSMLIEDNVRVRTLDFFSNDSTDPGGHAILGYKVEQDPTFAWEYNIYVYDNSHPDSLNAYFEIDTIQNIWTTYYAWTNWGGSGKMYLREPAENYLSNASFSKLSANQSPFILGDTTLQIFLENTSSILILNEQNESIGYMNGILVDRMPSAFPFIIANGGSGPPKGYDLITDNYSVRLNNFSSDTFSVGLFASNKSFVYKRNDAINSQTDRLFYDGGVSAVNPNNETKTVSLLNLINETTQEKLFSISELDLAQNDSVKIINPDDNTLDLISYGSAKNYQIELNHASQLGLGRFQNNSIQLTQNTTHKLVPNWTDLTNSQLTIYVDEGNDGTIDDTLYIANTVDVKDEGGLLTPNEYNLAQNYPNPFNPTTTIRYSIPQSSNVILKVYDVLGNEVATLVNEEKDRGVYTVNFDASQLASGIYFYRLQASSFVETKKMIILK
jgi:probable HAF family extracellular repeat protein